MKLKNAQILSIPNSDDVIIRGINPETGKIEAYQVKGLVPVSCEPAPDSVKLDPNTSFTFDFSTVTP